jgi:hypothetical protein
LRLFKGKLNSNSGLDLKPPRRKLVIKENHYLLLFEALVTKPRKKLVNSGKVERSMQERAQAVCMRCPR